MRISDWSSDGCSSDLTKLIRGGLRYLEHDELSLGREARKEREVLWGIAPHIIHPLRFVLPYRDGLRPRWLLRLGLFLYDHIGGRRKLPATRSVDLRRHVAGAPLQSVYVHGRSEEHTSELQSLMRISYAVFCLKKKKNTKKYS